MSMTGGGIYPDMHDQSEPLKILVISCDSLASKKKAAMIRNHPNVHASRYFEGRSWGCAGLDAPCGFGVRWVRLVRVGQCSNGLKLRPAQQKTCQLLYTVLRARTSMPNPSMSRQRRFASTRNHYIMDYYCTIWHVICIDVSYPMLINVVPTVSGTCPDSSWFCSQYTRANTTTYLARKVGICHIRCINAWGIMSRKYQKMLKRFGSPPDLPAGHSWQRHARCLWAGLPQHVCQLMF